MPVLGVGPNGGFAVVVQGRGVCHLVLQINHAGLGHVILDQAAERNEGQQHRVCFQLGGAGVLRMFLVVSAVTIRSNTYLSELVLRRACNRT